jgi:energy-coupling factor transporter ATP-binding protein EcfA2
MNKLYLIRGLPGSGKSTYAQSLGGVDHHYEADMYFIDPETGEYKFDASAQSEAHAWCQESTLNALIDGFDVVVSNTFTTYKEIKPYLIIADYASVDVHILTRTGDYGSIHDVPDEAIEKMRTRFQSDVELKKIIDERFPFLVTFGEV